VADRLALLDHLLLRLVVLAARPLGAVGATLVQQELRERQVARVAGHPVELDEAHLGDLVPGPDRLLSRTKRPVQQLRRPESHVQQAALAGGLVVRHRRFVEVTQVVELVAVHLLADPALITRPAVRAHGVDGPGRVEVAVLLLGGGDLLDETVQVRFQLGIGLDAQRVGGALDHLVDVGVVEGIPGGRLVLERLALEDLGRSLEVVDPLRLLALLEGERDRHRPVDLDARQPERVVEVHRSKRHRLHGVVARRLCGGFVRRGSKGSGREDDGAKGQRERDPACTSLHGISPA
jgi:hypothetical protein